jgi:hypothetical protein
MSFLWARNDSRPELKANEPSGSAESARSRRVCKDVDWENSFEELVGGGIKLKPSCFDLVSWSCRCKAAISSRSACCSSAGEVVALHMDVALLKKIEVSRSRPQKIDARKLEAYRRHNQDSGTKTATKALVHVSTFSHFLK